jgi:hypothetical protein
MTITTRRFAVAFTLTVFFACALNAIPFLLTRGAYNGVGLEIIGFPFTFRLLGGFAGIHEFRTLALFADLTIGVVARSLLAALAPDFTAELEL